MVIPRDQYAYGATRLIRAFQQTTIIMSNSKSSPLNPKSTSYEFLGPPGAFLITIGVPILTFVFYFTCNESSCTPPLASLYPSLVEAVSDPAFWWKLWDPKAFTVYYIWYAFCLVAWAVLPGDWVQGTQLRNGQYQQYKINGTILSFLFFFETYDKFLE